MSMKSVLIIGGGFFGASLQYQLSSKNFSTILVDPGNGDLLKSHNDSSRLVRSWHSARLTVDLVKSSLEYFKELEALSGYRFIIPVSTYYSWPFFSPPSYLRELSHSSVNLPGSALSANFADRESYILHPFAFLKALRYISTCRGGEKLSGEVRHVDPYRATAEIIDGQRKKTINTDVVIDARGLYSISQPQHRIKVVLKTVLHFCPAASNKYAFINFIEGGIFQDFYGFNGFFHEGYGETLKVVFTENQPVIARDIDDVQNWYDGGYAFHPEIREGVQWVKENFSTNVNLLGMKPCAFTITPTGKPDVVTFGSYCSISGCNGGFAQTSLAWAKKVADSLENGGVEAVRSTVKQVS